MLALVVLLAALALLWGWEPARDLARSMVGPRESTAVKLPAREPAPTTPPAPARPPVVAPTPSTAPAVPTRGAPTQAEAQSVVRAWFEALAAGDYRRAEGLTAGNAAAATRALADTIESEAIRQRVGVQLVVRRLDLAAATGTPNGQAVRGGFDIDINALIGPAAIPVEQVRDGAATFVVGQAEGGARITDIREVAGLPIP